MTQCGLLLGRQIYIGLHGNYSIRMTLPLNKLSDQQIFGILHNIASISCKNVTRLLSVTVWWMVILVHEVASLLRFDAAFLDR
jgi:hypothetical protein